VKRREFITLLGGAAAWPVAARAQQRERMRRIGVLINLAADDPESPLRVAAFALGLSQLGWTAGRNVQIEYRWGAGDADRIRKYAAELVALAPDVIVGHGSPIVGQLQQLTQTVPIVFVSTADPVGAGLVASFARPGGNTTDLQYFPNSASAQNGWSCSRRSRPGSPARRSCATRLNSPRVPCWAPCRRWRRRSVWISL